MRTFDTPARTRTVLLGILFTLWLFPVAARAAQPPLFTHIPEGRESGPGAGQLNNPRAVASDPASGHIYVADRANQRIDEFTAWGEFVKAWGWGVDNGAEELQTCTASSGCQAGLSGTGAGQFSFPSGGAAVDSDGNVVVGDMENHRVEKFNSDGEFLLMFGGGVDKTTNADVCTQEDLETGDECGAGTPGTGNAQFATTRFSDYIEYSLATNSIWVGDANRIQEFGLDGIYKSQLALPLEKEVTALAIDRKSGAIYVTLRQPLAEETSDAPFVYKHTASGWTQFAEVGEPSASPFPIHGFPGSLATDSEGNVYVTAEEKQAGSQNWQQVLEFDSSGSCVLCLSDEFAKAETVKKGDASLTGIATGFGCGISSAAVYIARFRQEKSFIDAYGPTPDPLICEPPHVPPTIVDEYALSASSQSALVRAAINPHFWADATFYVEYGTGECSKGGCEAKPLPPGVSLGGGPVNIPVTASAISLTGLTPATTYHYRFVAVSSGGGPTVGKERTFTTFPTAIAPKVACANQEFRTGLAAFLPDCRAYEMVSPVAKEGGDIAVLLNIVNERAGFFQSSGDGSKFTYSASRAFADPKSAPYTSQYLASRKSTGWTSESISPPREGETIPEQRISLDRQYMAFSDDLCQGWLFQDSEPVLDPAAPAGFTDLYRRAGCGEAGYTALNPTQPSVTAPGRFWPELQGHSDDGSCAVFRANDKLTPNASPELSNAAGIYQTYESCNGQLRLVSALPDGSASSLPSSAGTASGARFDHRDQSVWRAISRDGSRVYWTAAATPENAAGKIYVRDHADREPSAVSGSECLEPENACTYEVSASNAQFWTADPEGDRALFTISGQLREYDFASKASSPIAGEVIGLLGTSEDLSRIYLVSKENLAGAANAGLPNLYLYEGGSFRFIATLSAFDAFNGNAFVSPLAIAPSRHVARVAPDGGTVAFMSTAPLTGYDNTDVASGEADAEVYLYDASANGGAGKLICVSCLASGARPQGREVHSSGGIAYWAAAEIPTWESQLYPERALSADGTRLFFESSDPLVLRDTNGKRDVYEWQAASTQAECEEAGAELFAEQAGGCISLISSGQSPQDSEFLDASPDGSDVFFGTASSLLPQDPGLVDVYDARVEGGFPSPLPPVLPCEGESCRESSSAPSEPSLSSSSLGGRGNVKPAPPKLHCKKGKVRRKGRCVAKKRGHRKSGHHRGSGGPR
jgi:DNA-binding beta-propeller fold protein YncE